jgi:hypothetical protein
MNSRIDRRMKTAAQSRKAVSKEEEIGTLHSPVKDG